MQGGSGAPSSFGFASTTSRVRPDHTLPWATAETHVVLATARALLAATWPTIRQRGLTLVGVSVANLESVEEIQLVLPLDGTRGFALDAAVDEIRDRFGSAAITRAVLLGRDPGLVVPLLPD